jgi:hypothetical protein
MTVLAFRFLLELGLLAGLGYWGWHLGNGGAAGAALAVVFPLVAAVLWAVFRVPNDPSANPRAIVPVHGWLRLAMEVALIGLAAYGVWTSGSRAAAETLLTAAVIQYAVTWERIVWLLRSRTAG